jgi:hypothetical protein
MEVIVHQAAHKKWSVSLFTSLALKQLAYLTQKRQALYFFISNLNDLEVG